MTFLWRHLGNDVIKHSVQILIVYAFTNVKYIPAYRLNLLCFVCIYEHDLQ